ncbi:MAG: response regulator transcription factor [Bacteroidetes bacterium]|nr:response regulator transcription factor [Bacteroidota bacterium]
MIKVILIDDEPLARQIVKEYLANFKEIEIVAECGDGFEAVKAIQQHNPALIFLDIQMPKINGFETLELIEKKPSVIFTTAFDEYALKAFEQNAVDYLLKPFNQERFEKAVKKFIDSNSPLEKDSANSPFEKGVRGIDNHSSNQKIEQFESVSKKHTEEAHRVVVKNGTSILILPTTQIIYIEAYDDYVKIFNNETFYLKKKTMSYYEEVLDPSQFVRIHRSFILNLNYLTKIEALDKNNNLALLKNGAKIPLSRTGYSKLKEILNL